MNRQDWVKLWIIKAENDIKAAEILIEQENAPTDVVCFHAQQAVEKLLKGYLTHRNVKFPKTHDILVLLNLCSEVDKDFATNLLVICRFMPLM